MISIAMIDQQLSQQGKFCLIDWMLSENLIHYAVYEDWRYGRLQTLVEGIDLITAELNELLATTEQQCGALNLSREPQEYIHWNDPGTNLKASNKPDQHSALTCQWMRPEDVPQLDLFLDNSTTIAENQLRDALAARQFDLAQQYLQQLVSLNSQHLQLGMYQDLVNYGLHMQAVPQINDKDALETEMRGLQQEVMPLSREVLGQAARDYLTFAWRRLADNLEGNPFDPAHCQLHRSYALQQIPDWPQSLRCVQNESALYQQPVLLERLADAFSALQQGELALLSWCVMMERFGQEAEAAIEQRGRSEVADLWDLFWECHDSWPRDYFPAFVLSKRPGLVHHLRNIPALEQPASQAMITLLKCRIAGEDEIAARAQLQSIDSRLLVLYMAPKG